MSFFFPNPARSLLFPGLFYLSVVVAAVAQETPARPALRQVFSQASDRYPVEVRGPDTVALSGLLDVAENSCRIFLERMGLPQLKNFKMILDAGGPDSPNAIYSSDSFRRKIRRAGDETVFRVFVEGPAGKVKEQIYRSCMICYLQHLEFQNGIPADTDVVPDPPFWLSEGLTQIAFKSREDTYAEIVRRYQRLERMPELKTVQEWRQPDDHSIKACWQQAFSVALVRLTTGQPAEKQALALWLGSGTTLSKSGLYLEPSQRNEAWWRVSATLPKQSFTLYDWDKTVASLNEVLQVGLTARGESEGRVLSLADLPDPARVISTEPLNSKVAELALLRQCAHPMWVPVIEMYRIALMAWLKPDMRAYTAAAARAVALEKGMGVYMEQVRDYLDYVTVNYPVDTRESSYVSYREMMQSLQNSRFSLRTSEPGSSCKE